MRDFVDHGFLQKLDSHNRENGEDTKKRMKGDAKSTPTTKGGQPKVTSQESRYATQRSQSDTRPVCQQTCPLMSKYGGARRKVKHAAEGKPKGFTPFALDDIVRGNLFESPLPNSLTYICRAETGQVIKPATYDGTS